MNQNLPSEIGTGTQQVQPITTTVVGERFHPTDEELVDHYLKGKLLGVVDDEESPIGEVNVYKCEPWELPGRSKIGTTDHQWYFISPREHMDKRRKRYNRKTQAGYWKSTGKIRKVLAKRPKMEIGTKRTLVFYYKNKTKTGWVMHEYNYNPDSKLNVDEFAIIKLKKKPDDVSAKFLEKGSGSGCETTITHDSGTHFESIMTTDNSVCHSSEVISYDHGNDNIKKMTAISTYDQPSIDGTSSCENQSSFTEMEEGQGSVPETPFSSQHPSVFGEEEVDGLMASDFDYEIPTPDGEGGVDLPLTMTNQNEDENDTSMDDCSKYFNFEEEPSQYLEFDQSSHP